MRLRGFFSLLALFLASLASMTFAADAATPGAARQIYELRVYTVKNAEQHALVNEYWEKAAVPAYTRAGIQPIGVFTENEDSPTNSIYVLIPFESLRAFEELPGKLAADSAYQTASGDFMNRSRNTAPYQRMDTTLLHAMTGMPKLAAPPSSKDKSPWIFELRTYFSPTEAKGANKVDMFNDGEIQVMQEIGLNPVFFAGAIAGPQIPKLVYMTSGPDMEKYRAVWRNFGPHPVWKKLSGDPKYKDNMTGIQSVFLKRTSASQI